MLNESIVGTKDKVQEHRFFDQNAILHEYESIISSLKEELSNCKLDQKKLHLEFSSIKNDNKNAQDNIRRSFEEYNYEICKDVYSKETTTNLEKRVTILQMEKDAIFQLWQMSLKAIETLENEVKTVYKEDKSSNMYQEQINNLKETYSEAILALESKLLAAKENFFQQQTMWEKSKETIDQLTKDKNNVVQELNLFQQKSVEKENQLQASMDLLKENLKEVQKELKEMKQSKTKLAEKLKNTQQLVKVLASKDHEAKSKVFEAVNLIESAVKEKEAVLRREAHIVDEKRKLETCLSKLSQEYTSRLKTEVIKAKETYDKNIKKYLLEIKELKVELREQGMLLDKSHRDFRIAEEELERFKEEHNINDFMRPNQLKTGEEIPKIIYDDRIHFLEDKIDDLQKKLSKTSEKLKCFQLHNNKEIEDNTSGCTKELIEKCSNFEKQLSLAVIDKEYLTNSFRTLEASFEQEIKKRNREKILLESKIRDLQDKIMNSEKGTDVTKALSDPSLNKPNYEQGLLNVDSLTNILCLQEKFDKKTRELTQHVETHQKLSNKWKEEANLLTSKFQKRTEEFKNKISNLQKQNEDLSRELLFYQQLVARCNTQFVQNYNRDVENR